ncbi:M23 family metallopeptidase [Wansuia hejianensis]|uniref:M23 family metallopeptidase n=1 Tax=Wansuia hejianensis TaxID=2763667 RepID=A0A926IM43_9FIRM|nr:M23 family metallopeptidase [Wansuia hejianensis]MBC8590819.1 M23 family metallopeptidase [Wansuia hejianensis]
MKNKIMNKLKRLDLERLKQLKSFINKTIAVVIIALLTLILKKIDLKPTNKVLDFMKTSIQYEFRLVDDSKRIFNWSKKLAKRSGNVINVFNPISFNKYSSPINGVLYREYEKNTNEGIDIKSIDGKDPKAIMPGIVKQIENPSNKGYFITIEKDNMEITYGYLSQVYFSKGDELEVGDAIGILGTNQDGQKYLRIEMTVDGSKVDPAKYIDIE